MSKRLRDTELCQREILMLIESLSAKVDNLAKSSSPDTGCPISRTEIPENLRGVLTTEYTDILECRNVSSTW